MNIFSIAQTKQVEAETTKRGNNTALKSTITVPYFKGLYRKGEAYEIKVKQGKKQVKLPVKPLTGAFIISYCTALTQCLVNAENDKRLFSNDIEDCLPVEKLTTYLIEVVIALEGFTLDDYKQGKTSGAKRIAQHLKAIASDRQLPIDVKGRFVSGVTPEIVNAVLTAI